MNLENFRPKAFRITYRKRKSSAFGTDLKKLMKKHGITSLRVFGNFNKCIAFDVDGLGICEFSRIENHPQMPNHNKLNTDYKPYTVIK